MYPRWAIRLESLVALPPERASFGQTSLSSGRLAQHGGAVPAEHHGLGVAKHSCAARLTKNNVSYAQRSKFLSITTELNRIITREWTRLWVKSTTCGTSYNTIKTYSDQDSDRELLHGKASLALHILQHTHSKKPHHVRIGIAKHHRPIESLTHGAYQEFSQNLHMRKKGGKARYCQRPKKCQQRLA